MSARQTTTRTLGRGRRLAPQTSPRRLEEEVYAAAREKRKADQRYKLAVKNARTAGVVIDVEDLYPNPDFKLRRGHIHIFPRGLQNEDHDHLVIMLSSELSLSCVTELIEKVTNGKVTYDRDTFDGVRWRVEHYNDEPQTMAAD